MADPRPATAPPPLNPLASLIFSSRWLQLPLYLGLIVAQAVYVFLFAKELWHLIHELKTFIEAGTLGLPVCASVAAGTPCTRFSADGVMWQTIIHCVFILSAIGIAYTDKLMHATASRRETHAH